MIPLARALFLVVLLSTTFACDDDGSRSPTPRRTPAPEAEPEGRLLFVRGGPGTVEYEGATFRLSNPNLALLRIGGRARTLTSSNHLDEAPAWSPNGRRIAFTRARSSPPTVPRTQLYVATSSGRRTRLLVPCGADCDGVGYPSWSRSGSHIAFVKGPAISTIASGGGSPTVVLDEPNGWTGLQSIAWSPQRNEIAFTALSTKTHRPDIFVLDPSDGRTERVTKGGFASPTWSPDGRSLAVTKARFSRGELHLVDVATGETTQLTDCGAKPCDDGSPTWSPDGRWIAFDRDGDLYVIPSSGGTERRVTHGPKIDCCAVWKPR